MLTKKLSFNFFIFFIFFLGLLHGGPSCLYAQDEGTAPSSTPTPQTEGIEDHDTKDLEKLLKRYNTNQEQVINDASKIHHIESNTENSEVDEAVIEELRPEDVIKDATIRIAQNKERHALEKRLLGDKSGVELAKSIELLLSPLRKLPEKELMKMVLENSKDTQVGPYLNEYPLITLFLVRLIRDKEAVPSLLKILENRDRLIYFAGAMICTLIFGFFLKRLFHKEDRSFFGVIAVFFVRFFTVNALRIGIFYYFFAKEFTPAMRIVSQTFF